MSQISRLQGFIKANKIEVTGDHLKIEDALIKILGHAARSDLDADELVRRAKARCVELEGNKECNTETQN